MSADVASAENSLLWNGGRAAFMVKATFGGGSVKLQVRMPDGSTYYDAKQIDNSTAASLTANGHCTVDVPAGSVVKAVATTATGVTAWLVPMSAESD